MTELPETPTVEHKLLRYLVAASETKSAQQVYRGLAEQFGLDWSERTKRMPNQSEVHWNNRVRTAMQRLVDQGHAERVIRDRWAATKAGRDKIRFYDSIEGKVKINL